jgi:hypothetical protein
MNEDTKRRADILMSLAEQAWTNMDRRRSYEWKLSIAIWSALAAFAAILLRATLPNTGQLWLKVVILAMTSSVGVTAVVIHYIWCRWAMERQHFDRDLAIHTTSVVRGLVDCQLDDTFQKRSKNLREGRWWSMGPQVAITTVLAIGVLGALIWRLFL